MEGGEVIWRSERVERGGCNDGLGSYRPNSTTHEKCFSVCRDKILDAF